MAGRGRAATLPAWMTAGGGAGVPAPGAPAAAPGAPAASGVAAPGSSGLMGMPGLAPTNQPAGAPMGGISRAPMMVPSGLSGSTAGAGAPSPTAAAAAGPAGGGSLGQPDTAAMAAAALAAAKAAAVAAGIAPAGVSAAAGAPAGAGSGQPAAANPAGGLPGGMMQQQAPGGGMGAPSPQGVRPQAAAQPGAPHMGAPGMMPPPYAGMPPPMFPPGMPPGMMPPPGMVPPGMPPFGAPHPGMPFGPPGGAMFPPHMAHMQPPMQPAPQQPQQPKSDWTEHSAPDGKRKYYFNSKTQQSTWVKPEELMTPEEKAKAAADKAAAAAAAAPAATPAQQPQAAAPAAAVAPAAAAPAAAAPAAAATPAAAAAGSHTTADIAKAWKQYTSPDGRPYFHNKITKQSKWVMPEEMKAAQAAGAGSGGGAAAAPAAASSSAASPASKSQAANGVEAKGAKKEEPAAPAVAREPVKPVTYPNKEAAKEAFKQLLQDFDVPPEATWDNAMRLIINDPRYGALKAIGEKKATFNEYCTARRAAEREEARKRQVAAKEGFMTLLEECAELKPGDNYDRASRLLNHDNRWKDLDSDALRRELIKDHIEALKRRRADEEKRQKEAAVSAFKELLERSNLKASSSWRKVQTKIQDTEEYESLDRLTRLEVFQEFIRGLEEVERQEREKEKELKRRQERRNRDSFRQLLQQHRDEGRINVRSRWKEYGPSVEEDEVYIAVKKNASGSRPKELFEDLIVELEEEYDKARVILKDALRATNWVATPDSTYPDYLEALSGGDSSKDAAVAAAADKAEGAEDAAAGDGDGDAAADGGDGDGDTAMADAEGVKGSSKSSEKGGGLDAELVAKVAAIRDSHKRVYFEEQVGRAKEKILEGEKKKKRALDKFVEFVRTAEGLYASTTWDEFEDAFSEEPEFVAVGAEVAREVFEEHVENLKAKENDKKRDKDDLDDEGGKKKKRSSRHDDDDHKKSKRHKRDRSRDRSRHRSRDRSRERSKDRKDKDRSRGRSRDRSKDRSKSRKRTRTPESGEVEDGEV